MNKRSVIIIGAGIGGLATAVKLARNNFKVMVVEKNRKPGGRCQQLVKDGHVFDTGPTMYLLPKMYQHFFASIGEDINKYVKLIRVDPRYNLSFADNSRLTLCSDQTRMRQQLERIEPGSFKQFLNYLEMGRTHYQLMDKIAHNNLFKPTDYFKLTTLLEGLKTKSFIPHASLAKHYFKHPNLLAAFTFQDSYLSLNPFTSMGIYSLFTYTEQIEGNYLPIGGMYQVIRAITKIALNAGVKIIYDSPVKKIDIEAKKAKGIVLKNGQKLIADFVVANADLSYVYRELLPADSSFKQSNKKYSSSVISFHWGLKKKCPKLLTHNLFFSKDYRAGFEAVLNRTEPPANPHFYVQVPNRSDPTRAPKNEDTVSVMVPINRIHPDHPVDWPSYRDQVREYILSRMEKAGIGNIKELIKFEFNFLPTDWQSYFNLTYGSVYGLDHNIFQVGYLRPHRQHPKYKNMFFVGASNHPGSGLPTVLLSSEFTSQMIIDSV
jgi:phytoene desaturase